MVVRGGSGAPAPPLFTVRWWPRDSSPRVMGKRDWARRACTMKRARPWSTSAIARQPHRTPIFRAEHQVVASGDTPGRLRPTGPGISDRLRSILPLCNPLFRSCRPELVEEPGRGTGRTPRTGGGGPGAPAGGRLRRGRFLSPPRAPDAPRRAEAEARADVPFTQKRAPIRRREPPARPHPTKAPTPRPSPPLATTAPGAPPPGLRWQTARPPPTRERRRWRGSLRRGGRSRRGWSPGYRRRGSPSDGGSGPPGGAAPR
jgi:hypothetical protein